MTWTAAIMPDDALPRDCFVGRMLNPEPECDDVPPVFPEDGSSLPVLTEDVLAASERAELPLWPHDAPALWEKMAMCWSAAPTGSLSRRDRDAIAAEIEALRDHMAREVDKPLRSTLISKGWVDDFNADTLVRLIQRHYSSYLTEQARIARGESP